MFNSNIQIKWNWIFLVEINQFDWWVQNWSMWNHCNTCYDSEIEKKHFFSLELIKSIKKNCVFSTSKNKHIKVNMLTQSNVKCRCRVLWNWWKKSCTFQILIVTPQLLQSETDQFYDQSLWCTIKNRYNKTELDRIHAKINWTALKKLVNRTRKMKQWRSSYDSGGQHWTLFQWSQANSNQKFFDEWAPRER